MIRYLFVLGILCSFLGSVSAQNIDSLRLALENADEEYELISTSHAIADYFFRLNLDSMAKYAENSIDLALEFEDDSLIAKSYLMAGNAALTKGNMDIALEYYTTGAEYVTEETYPILLEGLSNNIGIILYRKEEYQRALNYFLQAQELFTLFPDKTNYDYANALSALYANLGALYETLGEEEELSLIHI